MNGRHRVVLKGVHGRVVFELQRLVERDTGVHRTYLELTEQFEHSSMTPGLQEVAAYYSNRMSYEEVAGLVARLSGERLLSDQRIEQLGIDTAQAISQRWEQQAPEALPGATPTPAPPINREVDLYAAEVPEVRIFEDGIGVKGQKAARRRKADQAAVRGDSDTAPRVTTNVVMLEQRDGRYQYLCEGIEGPGQAVLTLEAQVRRAVHREYGDPEERLNVVAISDGASTIRTSLQAIFGTTPVVILDWYHLGKKVRALMSMIAMTKADKERHLSAMLGPLWDGQVEQVLGYLRTEIEVRNHAKHEELIGYLDKHRHEIIDYGARQAAGKPIGSGRMEKGVDQVIGHRQKKKGMAWSAKGSKALAILKVVELNGLWQPLWFPEKHGLKAAA